MQHKGIGVGSDPGGHSRMPSNSSWRSALSTCRHPRPYKPSQLQDRAKGPQHTACRRSNVLYMSGVWTQTEQAHGAASLHMTAKSPWGQAHMLVASSDLLPCPDSHGVCLVLFPPCCTFNLLSCGPVCDPPLTRLAAGADADPNSASAAALIPTSPKSVEACFRLGIGE